MVRTANKKAPGKSTRPADYEPQPGHKATLSLADFTDNDLFASSGAVVTMVSFVHLKVVTV